MPYPKLALVVDVVQHRLVLPLFCVGQLGHADNTLGIIEPVQKSCFIDPIWLSTTVSL